nr:RNA-directed DNA polymerase, eukaryota, reverse transcriptase zinc-binding domain protein [Tanacetum cinerariifolium]
VDYGPLPFKIFIRGCIEMVSRSASKLLMSNALLGIHEVMLKLIEIEEKIYNCSASHDDKLQRLNLLKEYDDLTNLDDMDTVQNLRIKLDVEDHDSEMNLGTVTPQVMLDVNDSNELEASVTIDEIKASVWDCGIQKALGPDGFSFLFLKSYLELLKSDVEASVVFRLFVTSFFVDYCYIQYSHLRASGMSTCPLSHYSGVPGRASGMSTCPLSHCSGVSGRAPGVAPPKITTQRNTTWGATS